MEYVLPGMSWMLLNEIRNVRSPQHPMWGGSPRRRHRPPCGADRMWSRPPGLPFIDGPAIFSGIPPSKPAETMDPPSDPPAHRRSGKPLSWMELQPVVWVSLTGGSTPACNTRSWDVSRYSNCKTDVSAWTLPTYGVVFTTPDSFPEAICPLSGESITLGSANRFPAKRLDPSLQLIRRRLGQEKCFER